MSARRLLLLTLLAVAAISLGVMAADQDEITICGPSPSSGNYTDGSQYEKNLAELLATLSSGAAAGSFHFHSGSVGGAAASTLCQDCLRNVASIAGLTALCPSAAHMRSVTFTDSAACLLGYADAPFLGTADTSFALQSSTGFDVDVADMPSMNTTRWRLLSQLAESAAGHDQRLAYGSQQYTAARNGALTTVYGLAQCTGDLEPRECTRCFVYLLGKMDMNNATQGFISVFSCYLRYQLNDPIDVVIGVSAPAPAPQPAVPSGR